MKATILASAIERFLARLADSGTTDHNERNEHGRKHGPWFESSKTDDAWAAEDSDLLAAEGDYVDGKRHGHWVLWFADGQVEEGPWWMTNKTGIGLFDSTMAMCMRDSMWTMRCTAIGFFEAPMVACRKVPL